jgi:hypothetical protein
MKFGKPLYISEKKIYKSEIADGFRCEVTCENNQLTPPIESFIQTLRIPLTQAIIQNTKGWFSKALTEGWLSERIQLSFPTDSISDNFEGTLTWQAKELSISKEEFIFHMELVEKRETPKVVIDFSEEPEPEPEEVKQQIRRREPLNRKDFKEKVMVERSRAGRALFRAERLTQEYCQLYGEETDWEESDDENGSGKDEN